MPSADVYPWQLGIGMTKYYYDGAVPEDNAGTSHANRVGRLAGVEMYAPATAAAPYAAIVYGYDAGGNVTGEAWAINGDGFVMPPWSGQRTFDLEKTVSPLGQVETTTYPGGQTASWHYDSRAMLDRVDAAGQTLATYDYYRAGQPWHRTRPAAPVQQEVLAYDTRGRLGTDAFNVLGSSFSRSYHYTPGSDIDQLAIADNLGDAPINATQTLTYDGLHRLRTASSTSSSYAATLSYSPAGRVLGARVAGTGSYLDRDVTAGYDPTGVAADVQAVRTLTNTSGGAEYASFAYDQAGNMTHRTVPGTPSANFIYAYDANDQARAAVTDSPSNLPFEIYFYDHRRERFFVIALDGQGSFNWRLYLGGAYEVDHRSDGFEETSAYVAGLRGPAARLTSATCSGQACQSLAPDVALLYQDRRGDLIAALGTSGAPLAHLLYGAFGEILYKYESAGGEWRQRFNGKEQDQLDGLSYYGYRYYDPLTLQWTSGDPLYRFAPDLNLGEPQRLNIYAFSLSNPLTYRDLNGLSVGDPRIDTFDSSEFGTPYTYETQRNHVHSEGERRGLSGTTLNEYTRAARYGAAAQTGVLAWAADKAAGYPMDMRPAVFAAFQAFAETGWLMSWLQDFEGNHPYVADHPVKSGFIIFGGVFVGGMAISTGIGLLTGTLEVGGGTLALGGTVITFGHGARHLAGTGLAAADVETAIAQRIQQIVQSASTTGSFWERIQIQNVLIEYRAYTLPNGTINVGTYYPIP